MTVKLEVVADAGAAAQRAADFIARRVRETVAARGQCSLAVSGGKTPWRMLRRLADADIDWNRLHLFQVDERVVPAGSEDRNVKHILDCLAGCVRNLHAMPVEAGAEAAAARYARRLQEVLGTPPVMDIVHLGLGLDGHTASLLPGDPALQETSVDVVPTGEYQGHRRVTLTLPLLARARTILWLVTGADKAAVLPRLLAGDTAIPAARVSPEHACVIADAAAASAMAA